MELLVFLVKSHKMEVEQVSEATTLTTCGVPLTMLSSQALSSDPCLRSEIEYDLRMFEKSKETTEVQRHAQGTNDLVLHQRLLVVLTLLHSAIEAAQKTAEKSARSVRRASFAPDEFVGLASHAQLSQQQPVTASALRGGRPSMAGIGGVAIEGVAGGVGPPILRNTPRSGSGSGSGVLSAQKVASRRLSSKPSVLATLKKRTPNASSSGGHSGRTSFGGGQARANRSHYFTKLSACHA